MWKWPSSLWINHPHFTADKTQCVQSSWDNFNGVLEGGLVISGSSKYFGCALKSSTSQRSYVISVAVLMHIHWKDRGEDRVQHLGTTYI